jgi:hypothetical protein
VKPPMLGLVTVREAIGNTNETADIGDGRATRAIGTAGAMRITHEMIFRQYAGFVERPQGLMMQTAFGRSNRTLVLMPQSISSETNCSTAKSSTTSKKQRSSWSDGASITIPFDHTHRRLSTTSAADFEPLHNIAGTGNADAINSLSTWHKLSVRPV